MVFTEAQTDILNLLMDLVIPASPDGKMPAARSLDLYADISTMPLKDRMLFDVGLAEIQARSHALFGVDYVQLDAENRKSLIDGLRADPALYADAALGAEPALHAEPASRARSATFIQCFMTQTVARYLAHDRVMPLIGLEARAPWPKGHVVAQGDWSLIDIVRKRGKIYRLID